MATTDAKTGFRLPWSSDRTTDEPTAETAVDAASSAEGAPAADATPVSDTHFAVDPWTGASLEPASTDEATTPTEPAAEASEPPVAAAAVKSAPRKQNKFLADLTKAMQAAAEETRGRSISQLQADAKTQVETIHARSSTEAANLRRQADDDVAAVREWSKAEIARIREETEQRITDRKGRLETEIEQHAGVIEREIDAVQKTVSEYEDEMAAFFERLNAEEDPTRFATMAENLPEPPTFDDLSAVAEAQAEAEAVTEVASAPEAEAEVVGAVEDVEFAEGEAQAEPVEGRAETLDETAETAEAAADVEGALETGVAETSDDAAETETPEAEATETETAGEAAASTETETATDEDDAPRSFGGEEYQFDGMGEGLEGDGEVDREAAFAAIQAAAEAAASAEVAADAAARAEAVADVAIEIIGHDSDGDADPRFAALGLNPDDPAAFIDGDSEDGGIPTIGDDDLATRLAGLVPSKNKGGSSDATATQVIVVGLVSVASIASFKRHLGRVSGVQSVGVSSGPDGEFVFAVTHTADANLRDAIPSLPSFQARVTSSSDGIVHVTAHDPEADG